MEKRRHGLLHALIIAVTASFLWGCAAPYELTHDSDLPDLPGSLGDAMHGKFSDRKLILNDALSRFGMNLTTPHLLDCGGSIGCKKIDGKTDLPPGVIAITYAAAGECRHEAYEQDTSAVSLQTIGTFLGVGLLAAGIVNGITHGPSAFSTLTSVGGAGVTAASNVQKGAPTLAQASTKNIIDAVVSYYPLMDAKSQIMQGNSIPILEEQRIELLSSLWDTAGSACPPGVLKGRSWFNKLHDEKTSAVH